MRILQIYSYFFLLVGILGLVASVLSSNANAINWATHLILYGFLLMLLVDNDILKYKIKSLQDRIKKIESKGGKKR